VGGSAISLREISDAISGLLESIGYKTSVREVSEKTLFGGISKSTIVHGVRDENVVVARISDAFTRLTIILKRAIDEDQALFLERKGWRVDTREDETILTLRTSNCRESMELIRELVAEAAV